MTTVAASTHDRGVTGSATLGNGVDYARRVGRGHRLAPGAAGQLRHAAPVAGAERSASRRPNDGAGRSTRQGRGKIVVCERGVNARIDKSLAVQRCRRRRHGPVNTAADSLNADLHFVPSVHLQVDSSAAVEAYAAIAGATATHHPARSCQRSRRRSWRRSPRAARSWPAAATC